jgi:hypothetical protein
LIIVQTLLITTRLLMGSIFGLVLLVFLFAALDALIWLLVSTLFISTVVATTALSVPVVTSF